MDFDKLSKEERYDTLTEMADLYYNQGKTQVEIAEYFGISRFKVAKLIQDARNEQIVEIKINYSNERNASLEKELKNAYSLAAALVVNTEYCSYIDSMNKIGAVGADYLKRAVTAAYFGTPYFLNMPLYVNNPELRMQMMKEPDILHTLYKAREMSVVLTGIGSKSSLPLINPKFRPYITNADTLAAEECIGSIYGLVLDKTGHVADIDLNKKLIAVPLDDILSAQHRIAIASGRHKTEVVSKAMKNGYVNEIVTNTETALRLIDLA